MKIRPALLGVAVLLASSAVSQAHVHCADVFTDHMVIQRDAAAPVWGTADPNEKVTVTFNGQTKTAQADASGKWMIKLDPTPAGGPFTLEAKGSDSQSLQDVLAGDVWICSGQSNMGFTVARAENAAEEIKAANYPKIRFYAVAHVTSQKPLAEAGGTWQACTPQTAPTFTAVGYFFGRDLHKDLDVPIGLINSSWGGTHAEAWTAPKALNANPDFSAILDRGREYPSEYPKLLTQYEKQSEALKARGDTGRLKKLRKPAPPDRNPNLPSVLYNAMIAPLQPMAIKGAIWYQGEANGSKGYQYRQLLPALITSWRHGFGEGDFPFLIVQLPEFGKNSADGQSGWAELREAQWLTARNVPNTGIAVAMGLGDPGNVHPIKKQEVGRRLALVAEKQVYGKDVVASGPVYKSMKVDGDKVELTFDSVAGGLEAQGGKVEGFTIAGDDKKFVPADAKIEGDHVVVSAAGVSHPVAVRYGWANSPTCTLYNKAGLPTAPFRTDDWPVSSVNAK